MRVQRVVLPDSETESWTVLGDDGVPVEPVERFLAYQASIERSPNTVKAYAHDLKDWFTFLSSTGTRTCGIGCCSRSCSIPGCGLGKPSGCGTRTSRSPSARSASCLVGTSTRRGRRAAGDGPFRPAAN